MRALTAVAAFGSDARRDAATFALMPFVSDAAFSLPKWQLYEAASEGGPTHALKRSAGVPLLSVFRGRSLSCLATAHSFVWLRARTALKEAVRMTISGS